LLEIVMNLPWKDRPVRELIRLAWPIAVSMLSYSVMTSVDTWLVGHVGRAELAGVGLAGTTAFMLLCFSMGVLQGAKVLVSQARGAGRVEHARAYLGAAVASALLLGLLTCALGQVLALFLPRFAATEAAGQAASTYLRIRLAGAPMVLLYVALREVRYAYGDAKSPMLASLAAQLVNLVLAFLAVRVLGWGVAGAASATVVAHAVEAGVLACREKDRSFGLAALSRAHLSELLQVGLPTGVQFALEVSAFAALSVTISLMSEAEMAAHQIALQVVHFAFLPALAVAEASSVLIGQAVGAGQDAMVMRVSRTALAITGAHAAAWSLILATFGRPLLGGFTPDTLVVATGVRLLRVAAVFQLFDAANIVARCALRGAGDVRYAAWVGVLVAWLFTPTLAWFLGVYLHWGAVGGWIGLSLEIGASAALLWLRLQLGGWRPAASLSRSRLQASAGSSVDALRPIGADLVNERLV
jgi:MATE family multidrug resistance protein